jgi:hypothetical protein
MRRIGDDRSGPERGGRKSSRPETSPYRMREIGNLCGLIRRGGRKQQPRRKGTLPSIAERNTGISGPV